MRSNSLLTTYYLPQDIYGKTALILAAHWNRVPAVKALLKARVDVTLCEKQESA